MQDSKSLELVIKNELLDEFCNINDFIIITDEIIIKSILGRER